MNDIQASLGIPQLARVESNWLHREQLWSAYEQALRGESELILPSVELPEGRHARHLFTVLVAGNDSWIKRDRLIEHLKQHGITVGIHYLPVHLMTFYRETFGYRSGMFPESEWIGERTLSLPLSRHMTVDDVENIARILREGLRSFA